MLKNVPITQRGSSKKYQREKIKQKQHQKILKSADHNRFFTMNKTTKKEIGLTPIDIKGKKIQKSIQYNEENKKPKNAVKGYIKKRIANSFDKQTIAIPTFNIVTNQKKQKMNLPLRQIRTKHTIRSNTPLNIGISTQRVMAKQKSKNNKEFCHMNEEILIQRRQSRLNSKFKQRVSRLNNITKQNRNIYCRINSQKSHYLMEEMNKSYESNMEISRRLSTSKVSQRSDQTKKSSDSRCSRYSIASNYSNKSVKSKNNNKNGCFKGILKNKNIQKKQWIKIQSNNVNSLKNHQIQHFATLFDSKMQTNNVRVNSRMSAKNIKSLNYKQNYNLIKEVSKTVQLKKIPKRKDNQKLPKITNIYQIKQFDQQIEQNIKIDFLLKKKILSSIDQNIPFPKPPSNNLKFLHKINQQTLKPSKLTFTFGSLVR